MNNVYYNPSQFGLTLLECLDEPGLSYEYHTLIVLQHNKTGRVFYAEDSGCSCPTPFEQFNFSATEDGTINTNLYEITLGHSFEAFRTNVENFPVTQNEQQDCITKVRQTLRRNE